MNEFQQVIDFYSREVAGWFSTKISSEDWGDIEVGTSYSEKYWLSDSEYELKWKSIQKSIFPKIDNTLPNLIFSERFKLYVVGGGCLFVEEDFDKLKQCMEAIGEKYFIVIENDFGGWLKEPAFKLKFPANISWLEINSGNFASASFIESIDKEFFVLGESGKWGKYSANDYDYPLDIIGCKPEYRQVFRPRFTQSAQEKAEIGKYIPDNYIKLMDTDPHHED
jgi:hypothetical protein